jgi:succinate--hydroxymethylglutarate CoA-transferase
VNQHPLAGLRVVELAGDTAGAFTGMLLADLGADVVKVEPPTGDVARTWPPLAVDVVSGERFSHTFAALNRNKRSVAVELESAPGRARAAALVARADVVVESLGRDELTRLGLGYDDVTRDRSRGLVYCSVSGFGPDSPYAVHATHDLVVQGMSGLGPGAVPGGGSTAGLYAALTVASFVPSLREGRQVHLDCATLDCLLAAAPLQTSDHWATGSVPPVADGQPGGRSVRDAPCRSFRARNGDFTLAVTTDQHWAAVARVVGLPQLADDPRFRTSEDRVANQTVLAGILQARFGGRRYQYWVLRLRKRGVPCGRVTTLGRALKGEHARARGLVQEQKIPVAGVTPTVVYPVRVAGVPSRLDRAAPELGADTDDVPLEWAETALAGEVSGPSREPIVTGSAVGWARATIPRTRHV